MSKWIDLETDASTGKPYLWKCDECGEEVETRWNYCPECGDPKTSKGKSINTLVKTLETEHRKLREMQSATDKNVGTNDTISRQAAVIALSHNKTGDDDADVVIQHDIETLKNLPPAKRETATVSVGISKEGVTMWYECDACGEPVDQGDTFCSGCGRKLKHE